MDNRKFRLWSYKDGFLAPLDAFSEMQALDLARRFMRKHMFRDAFLQKRYDETTWKTVCRVQIIEKLPDLVFNDPSDSIGW